MFDGIPVKEYYDLCSELCLAEKRTRSESLVLVSTAGAEPEIRRQVAGRYLGPQSPAARLQTSRRISGLGQGFSAHCIDEDQAASSGGRNRQIGWTGSNRGLAVDNWDQLCRRILAGHSLYCIRGSRILGKDYLAIVNPAAGGGRTRKLLGPALKRLRREASRSKSQRPTRSGDATQIARDAYGRGVRNFIAVGGDGTSYEIVNGLFPQAIGADRPTLGLPATGYRQLLSARLQ